ncbi:hypothetical protein [Parasitella parasitica]|uniref:F-box domain-containing protein n=1 Tax=Parasitella parasitica TaxID=35722 RepID=A0A0B7NGR3_9FUNG|nr:hypothetical protein [Parasitella parasitica]
MSIQNLPLEILLRIFYYINDLKTLKEVELVCRGWKLPAIKTMLGDHILLEKKRTVWSFYEYLEKNQDFKKWVKYLDINCCTENTYDEVTDNTSDEGTDSTSDEGTDSTVDDNFEDKPCKKLLPFIFTENLVILAGDYDDQESYTQMLTIIEENNGKEFILKRIPLPRKLDSLEYQKVARKLKKTLEELHIMIFNQESNLEKDFREEVKTFQSLKSLSIAMNRSDVNALNSIVSNCRLLRTLDISCSAFTVAEMTTEQVQNEFCQERNLEKLPLAYLKIENCIYPSLVEYLVLKYSIQIAIINMADYEVILHGMHSIPKRTIIQRVFNALRGVPKYELIVHTEEDNPLETIIAQAQIDIPFEGTIALAESQAIVATGQNNIVVYVNVIYDNGSLITLINENFPDHDDLVRIKVIHGSLQRQAVRTEVFDVDNGLNSILEDKIITLQSDYTEIAVKVLNPNSVEIKCYQNQT